MEKELSEVIKELEKGFSPATKYTVLRGLEKFERLPAKEQESFWEAMENLGSRCPDEAGSYFQQLFDESVELRNRMTSREQRLKKTLQHCTHLEESTKIPEDLKIDSKELDFIDRRGIANIIEGCKEKRLAPLYAPDIVKLVINSSLDSLDKATIRSDLPYTTLEYFSTPNVRSILTPGIVSTGMDSRGERVVIYAHVPNFFSNSDVIECEIAQGRLYKGRLNLPKREWKRLLKLADEGHPRVKMLKYSDIHMRVSCGKTEIERGYSRGNYHYSYKGDRVCRGITMSEASEDPRIGAHLGVDQDIVARYLNKVKDTVRSFHYHTPVLFDAKRHLTSHIGIGELMQWITGTVGSADGYTEEWYNIAYLADDDHTDLYYGGWPENHRTPFTYRLLGIKQKSIKPQNKKK